jgi:hypothetical protein
MRRALLPLVAALVFFALPSVAAAQPCPPFDGGMSFPEIHGPEDPEDYCWEVRLEEGQYLQQVSETEAEVFYEEGHPAFVIKAASAHDAVGTTVPTTLTVTDPNLITLTVHHRAGNPAAGGAIFDYPVTYGLGWKGGFQTVEGPMPPPTEQSPVPVEGPPPPTCEVPILQGRTVQAARRALLLAGCELGPIRGHRHRGARIVKQYRPAFKVLPAGTAVGVKLPR